MITTETINFVDERSQMRCENPFCRKLVTTMNGEHHHIYWRSQYKGGDRHDPWNIVHLCHDCHYSIHSQGNTTLDKFLKAIADKRKPVAERAGGRDKDLDRQKKVRQAKYRRDIKRYKAANNGLSPWQVRYRKANGLPLI